MRYIIKKRIHSAIEKYALKYIRKTRFKSYYYQKSVALSEDSDEFYITSDQRKIPIYNSYRYSVKAGWLSHEGLNLLNILKSKDLLSQDEAEFLNEARGERTLTVDDNEIRRVVDNVLSKAPEKYFIPETLNNNSYPVWAPERGYTENLIKKNEEKNRSFLERVRLLDIFDTSRKLDILEIGFTSGGHSLLAFERMGHRTTGIDNYYNGIYTNCALPDYIKRTLDSHVELRRGDITEKTDFADDSFDIIYSTSVLEHIAGIENAFHEMHRLLKPGGIIIHSYNSFFSPNGGHALGILDSPWGHARMSKDDHLRYLKELRPFESAYAVDWVGTALNRVTMSQIQLLVSRAGFEIKTWNENPAPVWQLDQLTPEIISDALAVTPGITISDLIARNIFFAAKKKEN